MNEAFERLAEAKDESPVLKIEHREIRARRRAGGVVWFDFRELCGGPRSQNDYLELATQFHTLLLSGVPQMSPRLASEARRFTWLIDVLYDRRVKLIMSAEVEPEALYTEGPAGARVPAHGLAAARDALGGVPRRGAPKRRHVADMNPFRSPSRSMRLAAALLLAAALARRCGRRRAGRGRRRRASADRRGACRDRGALRERERASAASASSSRRASTTPSGSAGEGSTRCVRAS